MLVSVVHRADAVINGQLTGSFAYDRCAAGAARSSAAIWQGAASLVAPKRLGTQAPQKLETVVF